MLYDTIIIPVLQLVIVQLSMYYLMSCGIYVCKAATPFGRRLVHATIRFRRPFQLFPFRVVPSSTPMIRMREPPRRARLMRPALRRSLLRQQLRHRRRRSPTKRSECKRRRPHRR